MYPHQKLGLVTYDLLLFPGKKLPFGNNFKPIPSNLPFSKVLQNEEKEELVGKMVNKLSIDFHSHMIPNQKYRKKLEFVKSKLLDEPFEDNFQLFNKSNLDGQIERVVEEIHNIFPVSHTKSNTGAKRKRTEQGKRTTKR